MNFNRGPGKVPLGSLAGREFLSGGEARGELELPGFGSAVIGSRGAGPNG